ncbi:MAG: RNA polymerase sigma factor [Archangium sp.]|nr:RNA polymerase sigma factor [Archangium sp.]
MPRDVDIAWQRFFPLVREKCRRVLGDGDEANDVAQDTFIRFWSTGVPSTQRSELAWLYRTATHACVDRLRQRAMRERPVPGALETNELEAGAVSRQLLTRLVDRASADELEAAVLARLDGMTHAEAAEVLGVSERTVRRLISRFDTLAKELAP